MKKKQQRPSPLNLDGLICEDDPIQARKQEHLRNHVKRFPESVEFMAPKIVRQVTQHPSVLED